MDTFEAWKINTKRTWRPYYYFFFPSTYRIKNCTEFCSICTKCAPKIGQLLFKLLMLLENISRTH